QTRCFCPLFRPTAGRFIDTAGKAWRNPDSNMTGNIILGRIAMHSIWWKRVAAVLAVSGFSCAAQAQYVWLNERGVKQFSDMPPPASVPENRILKSPGAAPRSESPAATASLNDGEKGDSAGTATAS